MEEFHDACKNGELEIVRGLLSNPQVDPSAYNNHAIHSASLKGHIEVVRLLLNDPRVDPSAFKNLAIRWASGEGHLEVVRLLLSDPRVDPSALDNRAIQRASNYGHLEVVRLLLSDTRVLCGNQEVLNHPNIQTILKTYRGKIKAILLFGKSYRKEWRYLCPIIIENINN